MKQVKSPPLRNGEQIGVYEIKSLKHIGQTAIFYHVRNEHINAMELLAEYFPGEIVHRAPDGNTVECLSETQRTRFDRGLKRFLERAERWSEIKHPNVARVHNTFQFNGTGYLVMDDERGTPLIKLLQASTTFGQTELEFLLTMLLDALGKAHEKGIVHGDIHPSSILIKSSGEPVLIDFVANRLTAALDDGTRGNDLRLSYAAPEISERGYSLKPSADIYALGATFFHCITHADPLPPAERLSAAAHGEADPVKTALESVRGDYSETFLNTVLQMLEPIEGQRPQTADAVISNLGGSDRESIDSEPSETLQAGRQNDAPALRSSGSLWIAATVVILLIAFGLWSSGTDDRQPVSKATAPGQEVTEAAPEEKPTDSTAPEMPEGGPGVIASKTEPLAVPQPQVERRSETVTASKKAENEPINEPSSAPEQPGERPVTSQTEAETFGSKPEKPLAAENDEKQGVIEAHLAAAQEALTALRLTTPADDNAYSHYRAVLELDPESTAAKAGLQHIVDRYAWLIDQAVKTENYRKAGIYLDRAKAIKPDDAALEKLDEALKAVQP